VSLPQISAVGRSLLQTGGRSAIPKIRQRLSSVNCMQRTPAGLLPAIPGIGEEIDGAMQQAPQPGRHFIIPSSVKNRYDQLPLRHFILCETGYLPAAEIDVGISWKKVYQ
jgi:hypothetical protein